ncbi:uncharacterized protein LOC119985501 [Tripterygium wilfordii]|uniref:uncharacterized protein LOC119985501 n=1 Tax=Tripterygium wilfordii TaxID=458696 RepID=UPI0018F84901|nr:uncharacterized protein LOC119985501 [Tripterygium wilfordii]
MTRRRIRLGWIANRAARKATLKMRRSNLLKKFGELAILWHVTTVIIINNPNEHEAALWHAHTTTSCATNSKWVPQPPEDRSVKELVQSRDVLESRHREIGEEIQDSGKEIEGVGVRKSDEPN